MKKKLPEIICFYNSTKGGVDSLDQKCACYNVSRRSRRWPLTIFYAMVNIMGVNSHIIYNSTVDTNKVMDRRQYIISVGRELIKDHLQMRAEIRNIPIELRGMIRRFIGSPPEEPRPDNPHDNKRRRCYMCSNDNKHPKKCSMCFKGICKAHSIDVVKCLQCARD